MLHIKITVLYFKVTQYNARFCPLKFPKCWGAATTPWAGWPWRSHAPFPLHSGYAKQGCHQPELAQPLRVPPAQEPRGRYLGFLQAGTQPVVWPAKSSSGNCFLACGANTAWVNCDPELTQPSCPWNILPKKIRIVCGKLFRSACIL